MPGKDEDKGQSDDARVHKSVADDSPQMNTRTMTSATGSPYQKAEVIRRRESECREVSVYWKYDTKYVTSVVFVLLLLLPVYAAPLKRSR